MEGPTRGGWGPVNLFARMTRPSDMGVLYEGTSIDKPPKNIWHAGCTTVIIFIHSHLATPFNITAPKTNLTILTSKSNSVLNWFAARARCLRCRD
jgi:hypothetical protein